jgi:hypothetical protein
LVAGDPRLDAGFASHVFQTLQSLDEFGGPVNFVHTATVGHGLQPIKIRTPNVVAGMGNRVDFTVQAHGYSFPSAKLIAEVRRLRRS